MTLARVQINDVLIDNLGHPVTGGSLQILDEDSTPSVVYSAPTGPSTISQPLLSTYGQFNGWLDEGTYHFFFTGSGFDDFDKIIELQKSRPNLVALADVMGDPAVGQLLVNEGALHTFTDYVPLSSKITSDVSAGSTTAPVSFLSGVIPLNSGVMILDPYSANCEVKTIINKTGKIVTFDSPLLFNHVAGTHWLWRHGSKFLLDWFGADPTGVADIGGLAGPWQSCLDRGGTGRIIEYTFGGIYYVNSLVMEDNPSGSIFTKHMTENTRFKLGTGLPTVQDWDDDMNNLGLTDAVGGKFAYIVNVLRSTGYDSGANRVYCDNHDAAGAGSGPKRRPRTFVESPIIDGVLVGEPGAGFMYVNHHGCRISNPYMDYALTALAANNYSDGNGVTGGGSCNHPRKYTKAFWMTQSGDSVLIDGIAGNGSGINLGPTHGANAFGRIAFSDKFKKTRAFGIFNGHSEADNRLSISPVGLFDQASGAYFGGQYNPPDVSQSIDGMFVFDWSDSTSFGLLGEMIWLWPFIKTGFKNGDGIDCVGQPHWRWKNFHKNGKLKVIWPQSIITTGGPEEGNGLWLAADSSVTGLQAAIDGYWGFHEPFEVSYGTAYQIMPAFDRAIICKPKIKPAIQAVAANGTTDGGSLVINHWYSYVAWQYDELGNPTDFIGPSGCQQTANGANRFRLTIKNGGTVYIARGHSSSSQAEADTNATTTPEIVFVFPGVRSGDFSLYDQGNNGNKKPGNLTSGIVPATVAAVNKTTSAMKLDNGILWPDQFALCTADFARISTDGPGIVPGCVIPLEAYSTYIFEALIEYDATQNADMQISFALPSGADGKYQRGGIGTNATSQTGQGSYASTAFSGNGSVGGAAAGAGNFLIARVSGIVKTAATPGNLSLRVQQVTPDAAAPLTIHAGSTYIRAIRKL